MSRVSGRVFGASILLGLLFAHKICAQSMRLQDAPLGSVVQIGSFNYIKIAENRYMQSTEVTCPDGATVGGKYVKCFESSSDYAKKCSGGTCSCADGYEYRDNYYTNIGGTCSLSCGAHSTIDSADPWTCNCESGWYTSNITTSYTNVGNACTIQHLSCGANSSNNSSNPIQCDCRDGYFADYTGATSYTAVDGSCKYQACPSGWYANDNYTAFAIDGSTCQYRRTCDKWWYEAGNADWDTAQSMCPSGYSLPSLFTLRNYTSCINYSTWGATGSWWTSTSSFGNDAIYMYVGLALHWKTLGTRLHH